MRPDFSVLLLTTLIGVGQGLFLALFTVQLYALAGLLPPPSGHAFYAHGSLVALLFLVGGPGRVVLPPGTAGARVAHLRQGGARRGCRAR